MKIAIDAGHGGKDTGAVGPTGLRESMVNLEIALLVTTVIKELGHDTRLIRDTDVFVEIGERARIANAWKADQFVSIHCNSDGPSAEGIETLYKSNNGRSLAVPIQKNLINMTKEKDRGLKVRNDLGVLNGTNMPAALVEIGFISHKPTEDKLRMDLYKNLLADAIAIGIAERLGITVTPVTPSYTGMAVEIKVPDGTKVDVMINGKLLT